MQIRSAFLWKGKLGGFVAELPDGRAVIIPSPTLSPSEAEELLALIEKGFPEGQLYRDCPLGDSID